MVKYKESTIKQSLIFIELIENIFKIQLFIILKKVLINSEFKILLYVKIFLFYNFIFNNYFFNEFIKQIKAHVITNIYPILPIFLEVSI